VTLYIVWQWQTFLIIIYLWRSNKHIAPIFLLSCPAKEIRLATAVETCKYNKGKFHPRKSHKGPQVGKRYNSNYFFNLGTRWWWEIRCHTPATLSTGKRNTTHCTGGWVGPRASVDDCRKSHPSGIWSPHRPARSQYYTDYHAIPAHKYHRHSHKLFTIQINMITRHEKN
jgi:hypothetical protein